LKNPVEHKIMTQFRKKALVGRGIRVEISFSKLYHWTIA